MNFLFFFIPACIHCKFYKPHLQGRKYDDLAKCTKLNTTIYAEMVRINDKQCGISGKWFEQKL